MGSPERGTVVARFAPLRTGCVCLLALATGLAAGAASAQTADASQAVHELMVTSRWREVSLQEAPVSATVLTGADLASRNVTNLSQIGAFVPNLVFDAGTGDTGGSTNAQVFIRGVGQSDFLFTTEPGVGVYVDGVYEARAIGSMMDLEDVERVEVLRGPQGTAFGKNSVGGAINIITRRPAEEPGARASLTLGDYGRADAFATVDLPVVPGRLLGKVTFISDHRDGFVTRQPDGSRLGDIDANGGRLQLLWTADPRLEVLVSADYLARRETPSPEALVAVDPSAPLLGLWNALIGAPSGATYDGRFVPSDPPLAYGTGGNSSDLDQWGVSATASWRAEAGTLKSITAYRHEKAYFAVDADFSPVPYVDQSVSDRMGQFSQEVQWLGSAFGGRLSYVLGGLYFAETGDDDYRITIGPGLYQALEALPPGLIPGLGGAGNPANVGVDFDGLVSSALASRSAALFAHADYRLTDALTLSAGLRETWDHKDLHARFDRLASGVTAYDVSPSRSWSALTPEFMIQYRWSAEAMTYVSASSGYKAGGFNGRAQTAFVASRGFDPERLWTYEAGLKSRWFGGRATLDAAVFDSEYSNLQLLRLDSDGGVPVNVADNAGSARIGGFEVEATAAPTSDLRINLGVGYLDARYTRLNPAIAGLTTSSALSKTPKWTATVGAEYRLHTSLGLVTARSDYSYRSKIYNTADDSPFTVQQGYGLLGAQLALAPVHARWSVAVFGTNLTDTRYITNGLDSLSSIGIADVTYGRPREWGVRLDLRL